MLETGDNGKPRKGRLEFNILPSFRPSQVLAGDGSSVGGLTPEMLGGKGGKFRLPTFFFIVESKNGICCHLNKMDEFHSTNNSICHSPLQRAALFTFLLAQVGARVMLGLSTFQIVSGFSCVLCFVPCGIHEKPKESDPYSESHGWDGWDGWDGWGSGSLVCRELGLENLGTFGGMVLRIKSPWHHCLGVSF